MINLNISLRLPELRNFKSNSDLFYRYGDTPWKNKSWEVQIAWWNPTANLFTFNLDTRWKGRDHAGFSIDITLFGLMFAAQIYDGRHWNDETNDFYTDEEAEAEAEEWRNTRSIRREELREKLMDAFDAATLPGTCDSLALQMGRIHYIGEFDVDEFTKVIFEPDEDAPGKPRRHPGGF